MSYQTQYEGPEGTFTNDTGSELGAYLRVVTSPGSPSSPPGVLLADNTEAGMAVTNRVAGTGATVACRFMSASGTQLGVSAGVFASGSKVYAAAGGQIDDSGTVALGWALNASLAVGDVVTYALEK